MSETATKPRIAEWLREAEGFLPAEEVVRLRSIAAEQARRRLEQAQRELEEITGSRQETTVQGAPAKEEPDDDASIAKLVHWFGMSSPQGRTAKEFVAFVQSRRGGDVDVRSVYAELYRQSKPGGPRHFRKEGEKPNTRYVPRPTGRN